MLCCVIILLAWTVRPAGGARRVPEPTSILLPCGSLGHIHEPVQDGFGGLSRWRASQPASQPDDLGGLADWGRRFEGARTSALGQPIFLTFVCSPWRLLAALTNLQADCPTTYDKTDASERLHRTRFMAGASAIVDCLKGSPLRPPASGWA